VSDSKKLLTKVCDSLLACSSKPLIVGTLHSLSCLKKLEKKPQQLLEKLDFLEVRLDSLPQTVMPSAWPLPVIATARHPAEGGEGNLTITKRRRLLEEALLWATAIDVELRSVKQLASTIAQARERGCFTIYSFHDFRTVPSLARLKDLAARAKENGADLFKVAATVNDREGLLRLLRFQEEAGESLPLASMGMGPGGKIARLLLAEYGSALSYGWLYKAQISGQWSVEELIQIFHGSTIRKW